MDFLISVAFASLFVGLLGCLELILVFCPVIGRRVYDAINDSCGGDLGDYEEFVNDYKHIR